MADFGMRSAGEFQRGDPAEPGFEIFILVKIFDRNSGVRFHESMAAIRQHKAPVHEGVQGEADDRRQAS
jgi:hypothetical protein